MDLTKLLESEKGLLVVVRLVDLKEWAIGLFEEYSSKQQTPISEEVYYTVSETAKILNVSTTTLWRWHQQKYLVRIKRGGKVYYTKSAIDKFLETNH